MSVTACGCHAALSSNAYAAGTSTVGASGAPAATVAGGAAKEKSQGAKGAAALGELPPGGPTSWAWPIDSKNITDGFGVRSDLRGKDNPHSGIDISAGAGTPIYAAADGIVKFAGWNDNGAGNMVEINHGGGIRSVYLHQSKLKAKEGEFVRKGEVIGYVGSTGFSTGNHLHFGVKKDGKDVNPKDFVKP